MGIDLTLDIGIILAFVAVFLELRSQRNRDREQAKREQTRSQFEIYQRLELASIDLYRFEADHLDLIRPLYTGTGEPTEPAELKAYHNYVSQILNLFELQVELYCNELVDSSILETWLPWFNDVGKAPGFSAVWEDGLGNHYSQRLQLLMGQIMGSENGIQSSDLREILQ